MNTEQLEAIAPCIEALKRMVTQATTLSADGYYSYSVRAHSVKAAIAALDQLDGRAHEPRTDGNGASSDGPDRTI